MEDGTVDATGQLCRFFCDRDVASESDFVIVALLL